MARGGEGRPPCRREGKAAGGGAWLQDPPSPGRPSSPRSAGARLDGHGLGAGLCPRLAESDLPDRGWLSPGIPGTSGGFSEKAGLLPLLARLRAEEGQVQSQASAMQARSTKQGIEADAQVGRPHAGGLRRRL